MNKLSLASVALAVIASTIVVPHAVAQRTTPPPASDAKLMHDVEAVLQNEKGLTIVPKTSRGIVTLTGTVSSEGDKVLAGLEVGPSCASRPRAH
jgi:osmotically-inducible protein OsmY